ncbi:MAG: hypothetical protein JNK29_11790 [Anaerolineales bacterium]|nr:hypothetical protein [Anaerolineales bacterium]
MSSPANDPFGRPAGDDNPAFLSANRSGALAPDQKQFVQARLLPGLIGALFAGVVLLPLLICVGPGMAGGVLLSSPADSPDDWLPLLFLGFIAFVFVSVAGAALWGAWANGLALLDLNTGRVESGDGRLAWNGREYRGEVEGRRLRLLRGDERLPGAYRFYYLPRSGFILTAERLFLGGLEADGEAELRRALGGVFNWREDDQPDNAAGRLSDRQRAAQWWALGRAALVGGVFLVPFLVAFGVVFPYVFVVRDWLAGEPVEAAAWIPALCAPAFVLAFAAIAVASQVNVFRDLLAGAVESVEGPVTERAITTGSGRSRRTRYYYEVNDQRFQVSAVALQALVRGRRYRLYFLPRSKRVIGVEPRGA